MDAEYGNHLPFLKFVLGVFKPKTAIEFGSGLYSTPLIAKSCKEFWSFETSPEWFEKISKEVSVKVGFNYALLKDPQHWLSAINAICIPNFVFVDGEESTRADIANYYLHYGTNLVMCHDWNVTKTYRWDKVKKPENYSLIIYAPSKRTTALFIENNKLVGNL